MLMKASSPPRISNSASVSAISSPRQSLFLRPNGGEGGSSCGVLCAGRGSVDLRAWLWTYLCP